jgi:hypothetical protein
MLSKKLPDRLVQWLLCIFTGLLIVVGYLQWRTLDKTDATLKAEQRPWIQFDVPTKSALGWGGTELSGLMVFHLLNTGHSPALNVRGFSNTLLVWDDDLIRKVQNDLCNSFNRAQEEGYGSAVFPGAAPTEHFMTIDILKPEIDKFKSTPPQFPRPIVVGCFSYFYGADHSAHNTGFMYLIRPRPAQLPFVLPKEHEIISEDKYDLVPFGSSRID